MQTKYRKLIVLFIILFIGFALVGCQEAAEDTNEELTLNENVTLKNLEKIELGDPDSGNGGMTYEEVMSLMGDISPQFHSELEENGVTKVEANWWRYSRSHNYGTDLIGVKFVDGKAVSKFQEGLE
ncbi:hypothetical protein CWR48_11360 [Oceanobacillus arenosus]|uniref:DUF3862 domain-containing protein n=1 Tax=Oceanobacillus arenosus TaxID=1229153 RepID=A0A3D8PSN2_9BACI|nr:hypothetical protein [Oceanobacillus arenosus]RDW18179.1 hypothetical protein CWR48_11360 [Oceanobacillus arenosus]